MIAWLMYSFAPLADCWRVLPCAKRVAKADDMVQPVPWVLLV